MNDLPTANKGNMTATGRIKKYTYFIGVDVSAYELDYAVMRGKDFLFHRERKNEPADIMDFIKELKLLPGFTVSRAVFCMEENGIYNLHLINTIKKMKGNVVNDNPLHIKRSFGIARGKDDKIDAKRLAQYVYVNRETLNIYNPKRPLLQQVADLFSLRHRVLSVQLALQTPLTSQATFIKKGIHEQTVRLCAKSIESIREDIADIDLAIDQIIAADENFSRLNKIMVSVPGVGRITSIQILISTNEFININNPRKFACYAGIAPFKKESGGVKSRAKVSPIANRKVKALLHLCAMTSLRAEKDLKVYYDRKVAEGKPKMAVLNAVRNKIVLRIFTCVNQNRLYEKNYVSNSRLKKAIDTSQLVEEML
jgi:transposase